MSPGYLGEPDRSAPFDTNDVGFLDSKGRLTVIGRSDDVIVSGGENVSLPSVAAAVRGFDGVADAVALGVVDEEWGTVVWAMVEGSVDVADLTAAASEALAPAQRPKRWMVVGRLPALATGKPDLVAIRRAMDV